MAAVESDADPKAAIPVDLQRERRLVCVEYPGVVQNEDKMLQTLGGEEGVSRVRSWETPGPRERNLRLSNGRDHLAGEWFPWQRRV